MEKVILIICDGLGDRPIKQLGNKTPLEAARTPNLDRFAKEGITGLMNSIGVGIRPGSDTSHMAIFGFDPEKYYPGRGPIEAVGVELEVKEGDIALRANVGTVEDNGMIKDRRSGRIESTKEFVEELNGIEVDGIKFFVKAGTGHRAAIILRGKGLSDKVKDADPHVPGVKVWKAEPLDSSKEAKFTCQVLNKFLKLAHEKMKKNPLNLKRIKEGKLPANYLLVRGAGKMKKIPSMKEKFGIKGCCIAGGGLYKGISRLLGMDVLKVEGATGMPNTNLVAKFKKAKQVLKDYDLVFVHIKATDIYGEDGNFKGKKEFIEKIDKAIKELHSVKAFIALTGDHSTPCVFKGHSGDPVPVFIHGEGVRIDKVKKFGERPCQEGGIGRIKGIELMPELVNLINKQPLYGA